MQTYKLGSTKRTGPQSQEVRLVGWLVRWREEGGRSLISAECTKRPNQSQIRRGKQLLLRQRAEEVGQQERRRRDASCFFRHATSTQRSTVQGCKWQRSTSPEKGHGYPASTSTALRKQHRNASDQCHRPYRRSLGPRAQSLLVESGFQK